MYKISFKPSFIKQTRRLENDLLQELLKRVELLKDKSNHQFLKVHKLHGSLSDFYSFSITHSIRVIFKFDDKNEIVLLMIGSHSIYKR